MKRKSDQCLGMQKPINRRDFIQGTAIMAGAAVQPCMLAAATVTNVSPTHSPTNRIEPPPSIPLQKLACVDHTQAPTKLHMHSPETALHSLSQKRQMSTTTWLW